VVTQENVANTIEEIWKEAESGSESNSFPAVDRNDPETWKSRNGWPSADSVGIFGYSSAIGKMAFQNRVTPAIYDVYRNLMGKDELWVSMDRYGVMKPTKQVLLKDGVTRKNFYSYKVRIHRNLVYNF
jgi:hypothetical protein